MMPWSRDRTFAADTVIPPNFLNRCQSLLIRGYHHEALTKIYHASAFRQRTGSSNYASGRRELLAGGGSEMDVSVEVENNASIEGFAMVGEVVIGGNEFQMELVTRVGGGAENVEQNVVSPTTAAVHDVSHTFTTPVFVDSDTSVLITCNSPNTNAGSIYLYSARAVISRKLPPP